MKVQHLPELWRHFGSDWVAFRLTHAARMRLGLVRRKTPSATWNDQLLAGSLTDSRLADPDSYLSYRKHNAPRFFVNAAVRHQYEPFFDAWDRQARERDLRTPAELADEVANGTILYFEHTKGHIGFPPDWHSNPFTRQRVPSDPHWTEIEEYAHGDIKVVWEPSRFGFAYALIRAYWRTGAERYAECFWQLVESWRKENQPHQGVNWKCGQEISFRVMAWCFALYAFLDAQATTSERVSDLAQMIAVSGNRIDAHIEYALSQQNNHGISEALGLWTIGSLFPELTAAARWETRGRDLLESLARELIYDDGSFSQHSVNYQRLALHDFLWVIRLAEILERPFSEEMKARVGRTGEFLFQIQDETTGAVPYYGQNDGALILPLNNCDYHDFRPAVQAAQYMLRRSRCYDPGPWDEDLLWLFGPDALSSTLETRTRKDFSAVDGGYYTLRSDDGFVFTRCPRFRHRPGQADLLHVDLWWRGQNIACDAGTYSYNSPPPWDNPLAETAYHNTIMVDGCNQMQRATRYVWLPWARGTVRRQFRSHPGHLACWEGEHDGYQRLAQPARHRRVILNLKGYWLVIDSLTSTTQHLYRLHWLLPNVPYEWDESQPKLILATPAGRYHVRIWCSATETQPSLISRDAVTPRGWRAPYYHYREGALSLAVEARATTSLFVTAFGSEPCQLTRSGKSLELLTDCLQATIDLNAADEPHKSLIESVRFSGVVCDQVEVPE
jgi:heparinase II/III-like protein